MELFYVGIFFDGRLVPATRDDAIKFRHMYEGGDYRGWMFWPDVWYSVIRVKQLIRQIIRAEPTSVQHIFFAVQTRRDDISRLRPLQSDSDITALVSQGLLDMVEIFVDSD